MVLFLTTTFIFPVNTPLSDSKLILFMLTCMFDEMSCVMLFTIPKLSIPDSEICAVNSCCDESTHFAAKIL